jgi:hypothetical protein
MYLQTEDAAAAQEALAALAAAAGAGAAEPQTLQQPASQQPGAPPPGTAPAQQPAPGASQAPQPATQPAQQQPQQQQPQPQPQPQQPQQQPPAQPADLDAPGASQLLADLKQRLEQQCKAAGKPLPWWFHKTGRKARERRNRALLSMHQELLAGGSNAQAVQLLLERVASGQQLLRDERAGGSRQQPRPVLYNALSRLVLKASTPADVRSSCVVGSPAAACSSGCAEGGGGGVRVEG